MTQGFWAILAVLTTYPSDPYPPTRINIYFPWMTQEDQTRTLTVSQVLAPRSHLVNCRGGQNPVPQKFKKLRSQVQP